MKKNGKNRLFQHSTMAALVGGLFSGTTTLEKLMTRGNLGIGTLDSLDGELVIVDNNAYQICKNGNARLANPKSLSPYATVTNFEREISFATSKLQNRAQLENEITSLIASANIFYAVKITGRFQSVDVRVAPKQNRPFPPLAEAVKKQSTFLFKDLSGTIVGFFTPPYMSGISVGGYHAHFIDEARQVGGHVFDYELLEGTVEVAKQTCFELELPQTNEFLQSDLMRADMLEQIESAENK